MRPVVQMEAGLMADPEINDLRQAVKDVFGRELSVAETERYRGRMPTMLQNVGLLAAWASRLGTIGSATILRLQENLESRRAEPRSEAGDGR
jgi:hypothetical protein